jgi:hypothetical protein
LASKAISYLAKSDTIRRESALVIGTDAFFDGRSGRPHRTGGAQPLLLLPRILACRFMTVGRLIGFSTPRSIVKRHASRQH